MNTKPNGGSFKKGHISSYKGEPKIEKICPVCNKIFYVRPCELDRKYCTRNCMNKAPSPLKGRKSGRAYWTGKIRPNISKSQEGHHLSIETEFKDGHILCGGFKVGHGYIGGGMKKGEYCGEKNPNWKGGRVKFDSLETKLLIEWSNNVKERDGKICQFCGSIENLQAHHILSVPKYPEKIFDIDNGITLCYNCHRKNSRLINGMEFADEIGLIS